MNKTSYVHVPGCPCESPEYKDKSYPLLKMHSFAIFDINDLSNPELCEISNLMDALTDSHSGKQQDGSRVTILNIGGPNGVMLWTLHSAGRKKNSRKLFEVETQWVVTYSKVQCVKRFRGIYR